jgi:hypothetical protein
MADTHYCICSIPGKRVASVTAIWSSAHALTNITEKEHKKEGITETKREQKINAPTHQ